MSDGLEALRAAVHASLPRLLALVDRAPLSPTRGSADRPFWLYRTDKDHPAATYAQVAWPLALLATRPALGLEERLRERFTGLALDVMSWWAAQQHGDGSFDEWFPFERSHVATAFTTFGVAEAALLLGDRFAASPARARVAPALDRAARWLAEHHDRAVANHAAGALAALANVAALLPGSGAAAAAEAELQGLMPLQDEEGWFPEYGGADPGYGSVTLAWLALAARRLERERLAGPVRRLAAFLAPFVNPDGSFGGVHGRRATRYAWLTGFALLATRHAEPRAALAARDTLDALLGGLAHVSLPPPTAFDDRYLCFFALPDAVAALDVLASAPGTGVERAPGERPAAVFPRAGLAVLREEALHVVAGAGVGGALQAFLARRGGPLLLDDSGYAGRLEDGALVSSWRFPARARVEAARASSDGAFSWWTRSSPVARHPIALRIFFRTLGRVPAVASAAASLAKRRFTSSPRPVPLRLCRELALHPAEAGARLTMTDRIDARAGAAPPASLRRVAGFSPVHVPSAPLWLPAFEPLLPAEGPELAPLLRPGRTLEVTTTLELARGRATLRVIAGGRTLQEASADVDP